MLNKIIEAMTIFVKKIHNNGAANPAIIVKNDSENDANTNNIARNGISDDEIFNMSILNSHFNKDNIWKPNGRRYEQAIRRGLDKGCEWSYKNNTNDPDRIIDGLRIVLNHIPLFGINEVALGSRPAWLSALDYFSSSYPWKDHMVPIIQEFRKNGAIIERYEVLENWETSSQRHDAIKTILANEQREELHFIADQAAKSIGNNMENRGRNRL